MRKINEYENFEDIINLDEKNHKYIQEEILEFSEAGKKVNDKIDEFIKHRIIYSFNVSRFDGKGKFILRQLFKAYYENPRQMPKKQLIILIKNIEKLIIKYPQLSEKFEVIPYDFDEIFNINESNVDLTNLNPMLDILKFNNRDKVRYNLDSNKNFSEFLKKIMKIIDLDINEKFRQNYNIMEIIEEFYENLFHFCNSRTIEEINAVSNGEYRNFLLFSRLE